MSAATMRKVHALLKEWGFTVETYKGWESRKASNIAFVPELIVEHHTGGNTTPDSMLANGRSGLRGPLCHWTIDRDGTIRAIAAGYANHAGYNNQTAVNTLIKNPPLDRDIKPGSDTAGYSANRRAWGIEVKTGGAFSTAQNKSAAALEAAICLVQGWNQPRVGGHREITRRKIDPVHPMYKRRVEVAKLMKKVPDAGYTTIRVATINAQSNDPKISAVGARTWPKRAKDLTNAIVAAKPDIVLCQEATEDQRFAIRDALPGGRGRWSVWVRRDQSIIWDNTKFKHGPKTDITFNSDQFHGGVACTLTDKLGTPITVCSVHIPPLTVPTMTEAKQKSQLKSVIKQVDALSRGVRFIAGDFNSEKSTGWASPYWDAYSTANVNKFVNQPTQRNGRIDRILYRMGSKFRVACQEYELQDTETGSDHQVVVASMRVSRRS